MQPAKRLSCFSASPLFLIQVPLDRFAHLLQCLRHPQAGRMERATLIVVDDAAHRRAVVEDHARPRHRPAVRAGSARSTVSVRRGFGVRPGRVPRRRDTLPLEHGLFDLPQASHLLAHLNLGMAIDLRHGLGHVAEEMILRSSGAARPEIFAAIPVANASCRSDNPKPHRLTQRFGPSLGPGDQPPHFVGRRGDQRLGEPRSLRVSPLGPRRRCRAPWVEGRRSRG